MFVSCLALRITSIHNSFWLCITRRRSATAAATALYFTKLIHGFLLVLDSYLAPLFEFKWPADKNQFSWNQNKKCREKFKIFKNNFKWQLKLFKVHFKSSKRIEKQSACSQINHNWFDTRLKHAHGCIPGRNDKKSWRPKQKFYTDISKASQKSYKRLKWLFKKLQTFCIKYCSQILVLKPAHGCIPGRNDKNVAGVE